LLINKGLIPYYFNLEALFFELDVYVKIFLYKGLISSGNISQLSRPFSSIAIFIKKRQNYLHYL
jgi:hypothetical protein